MDKKTTLDILYQERNRLNQKYSTHGWNLWAAIGALSALTWTFLSQIETKSFATKEVISVFIICFCLYYLFYISYSLIKPNQFSKELITKRYYYFDKDFSNIKFSIISHIILFSFFIYSNWSLGYLSGIFSIVFIVLNIGIIVYLVLLLFLSIINIPIPKDTNPSFKFTTILILRLLIIGIILIIIGLIINIRSKDLISSIKFGFIIFGFYYLIILLNNMLRPNKILDKIDELVECALFEKKTNENILNELEILILGLELRAYFETTLINYFNAIDKFEKHCELLNEDIDEFKTAEKDLSTIIGAINIDNKIEEILKKVDVLGNDIDDIEKYSKRILNKIATIIFYKNTKDDIVKIIESVRLRFNESKEKYNITKNKVLSMLENYRNLKR
ncbi:hypothetical protein [Tenuifilum osseticum]|uniref:hypothetical protein n=1 Tax=Tenuifilum osseticum TaxID=3374723 RepID=UPI0034E601B3